MDIASVLESGGTEDRPSPLTDDAVFRFRRDGYVVVPSVFSVAAIDDAKAELLREADARSRTGVPRHVGSATFGKQAVVYPAARRLIFSDPVVAIVSRLLGHKPIYFGDSSVNHGPGYTGWHKDNRVSDRADGAGADWQGEYDLVRVGIYLQDCAEHSGGLLVRAGSHRKVPRLNHWARTGNGRLPALARRANAFRSRFYGAARFVDSRKGDVVVWTLRTTHAGHAVRIRGIPRLLLDPRAQQLVPKLLQVPVDGLRLAIFATFARPGSHYARYREYILGRDYFVNRPFISVEKLVPSTIVVDELRYSSNRAS